MSHKSYVNADWENALHVAQVLLEKNDISGAQDVLKPFFGFAQYKNIADGILQDYLHYKSFRSAYEKQDYKTVYAMANKHESFKYSSIFAELEKRWNQIISTAVNQILTSQYVNKSNIMSALEVYLGVGEKAPIIQLFIKDPKLFANFEQAVLKKDYESVFLIAEKYPMLKQSSEFISASRFGETLLANSELAVKKGDVATAKKLLLLLGRFPAYQANYLSLDGRISKVVQMIQFVEKGQYTEFFEICKRYPYLEDTEQYPKLLAIAKANVGNRA